MDHHSIMATLKDNKETEKMDSKQPNSSSNQTLTYQVSPGWAEGAVVMTGTSVEISINQLKELYFKSHNKGPMPVLLGDGKTADIEFNHRTEAVTITLQPQLGRPFLLFMSLFVSPVCQQSFYLMHCPCDNY